MAVPARRRVVITGMGCVSPVGLDVASSFGALVAGETGIGRARFDVEGLTATSAAELPAEPEVPDLSPKEARRLDRFARYAMAAAGQAVAEAGLREGGFDPDRAGAAIGSGVGGIETTTQQVTTMNTSGPRRVSPFAIPMIMPNAASGHVAIRYGLRGPNVCLVSACASGAHAIADGFRTVRDGTADVMVVGGAEAACNAFVMAGFARMRALSTRNDEPERASRPFDLDRDGFVLGEGAGVLVLESLEHAQARGATILGEMRGQASTADASHMVEPSEEGAGARRCMALALRDADLAPADVGYVNAHGTSTPAGDVAEARALQTLFGDAIEHVAVSSTKSAVGHSLGASGALEAVFTLCALREGMLPPTLNLDRPDPDCALDHVAHKARPARPAAALSNSFGFGGTNCSLVFARADA